MPKPATAPSPPPAPVPAASWEPLASLAPFPGNPRKNDATIPVVADSMRRFGFGAPLVARAANRMILAGHARLGAAKLLTERWVKATSRERQTWHPDAVRVATQGEVVVRLLDVDEHDAQLYVIADNRIGETLSETDEDRLAKILQELQAGDVDLLDGTGLTAADISSILGDDAPDGAGGVDPGAGEPAAVPVSRRGELYELGPHRLLCGDSTSADDVTRLMKGERAVLCATDPPYLVDYDGTNHPQSFEREKAGKVNNVEWDEYRDPAASVEFFASFIRVALDRALVDNPAFYQWHASRRQRLVEEAWEQNGLFVHQQIIWVKARPILTRSHFMWQHEPCQPPGTMVRVMARTGETKEAPIETLKTGDHVVAWDSYSHQFYGKARVGVPVTVGARHYQGDLYGVSVDGKKTWSTDAHQWTTRFSPAARKRWVVYLMRRGQWWRVGRCQLIQSWGFGVKQRLICEDGDAAWILSTHESAAAAQLQEQFISVRHGIPTTYWSTNDRPAPRARSHVATRCRDHADVLGLYERLDLAVMEMNARRALSDHGRLLRYPIVTRETTREKYGQRTTIVLRSCNLLPEVMVLPVPTGTAGVRFSPITAVARRPYVGQVYSLDVPRFQHYIADGIVTHNCFYGWLRGKPPSLRPPCSGEHTTVWTIDQKGEQDGIHPTQKPLEIFERPIRYHTEVGQLIYEPFCGSGTALIAAARLGRRCFAMELEPAFVDAIRRRWTGYARSAGIDPGPGALE